VWSIMVLVKKPQLLLKYNDGKIRGRGLVLWISCESKKK